MNPKYPIYIVTKGRWDYGHTSKALTKMKVPHKLIIEEQEYKAYSKNFDKKNLIILDKSYQDKYETCDDLGNNKSKGPGPARNFAWDYSISKGHQFHWVMDDNIEHFYRFNKNLIIKVGDGTVLRVMEDFVERYDNVSMAGPNYESFVLRRDGKRPPFTTNTRIYSCNLIRNDVPFRWRGRYNEDTDLSIMMLKNNWCTIQFNAFLQNKIVTQKIKGGNTKEFYSKEGTLPKSKMLEELHPDIAKVVWKFDRWHHNVDYSGFKNLLLKKKENIEIKKEIDNYGMFLKTIN